MPLSASKECWQTKAVAQNESPAEVGMSQAFSGQRVYLRILATLLSLVAHGHVFD